MLSPQYSDSVILVIDDVPSNIHLINEAIKGLGKCVFATSGYGGLEAVEAHNPDLILLDVEMPDLDGYSVCRALKADPRHKDIPIIFITSHTGSAHESLALELGAVDFITKPIIPGIARARAQTHLLLRQQNKQLSVLSQDQQLLIARLACEKEMIRITLNSIGDAVIATDVNGHVTFMNPIAEDLTDFVEKDALGLPIETVMRLYDGMSGSLLQNPIRLALDEKRVVGMALNARLHSAGQSIEVEDSAAPIMDENGNLTGAIIVFHDVSEARAMALKMTHLAHHDPLTNLPNRMLLQDRAYQAFQQNNRDPQRVAMVLIDIDNFKEINENYGYSVGDLLIKQVALQLQKELRSSETLSRHGGDEFVVLVPKCDSPEQVGALTQRLIGIFHRVWSVGSYEFSLAASAGVSISPDDARDVEQLYRHADAAMYSAKQAGGNRYHYYSAEIEARQSLRRQLEHDLQHLENEPFVLLFQPKIEAGTGTIVGAEALVRWRREDGELLPPSVFIPLAEETGLIIPLGKVIFKKACEQAVIWRGLGHNIRVAINVSPVQMEDPGFLPSIQQLLMDTKANLALIELEITETVFAKNIEQAASLIQDLKALGLKIALDDFGTGYSSLSYIKNYPFDVLKIDQSFVRNMLDDAVDQSIIQAIVQIANSLQLRLVAEGVETLAHAEKLASMGCGIMQGFYYAKPLPANVITRLLVDGIQLPVANEAP